MTVSILQPRILRQRVSETLFAADIIMLDQSVVVFHFVSDCLFYVAGKVLSTALSAVIMTFDSQVDDNELLFEQVLNGLVEVLGKLLSNGVSCPMHYYAFICSLYW